MVALLVLPFAPGRLYLKHPLGRAGERRAASPHAAASVRALVQVLAGVQVQAPVLQ